MCLENFVLTRILGDHFARRLDGTEEHQLIDAGYYREGQELGWGRGAAGELVWREAAGCAYMLDGQPVFEERGPVRASDGRRLRLAAGSSRGGSRGAVRVARGRGRGRFA